MQQPAGIKALRDLRVLEISWHDGRTQRIPLRTLRGECPCAGCVDELTGVRTLKVDLLPEDVAPAKMELSGNYGLKITWNDGHSTGLYTWQRLAAIADQGRASDGPATEQSSCEPR